MSSPSARGEYRGQLLFVLFPEGPRVQPCQEAVCFLEQRHQLYQTLIPRNLPAMRRSAERRSTSAASTFLPRGEIR